MEEQGDHPDGSSIKPVSSLRSHFEQLTGPSSNKPAHTSLRPVSPKPKPTNLKSNLVPPAVEGIQTVLRAPTVNGPPASLPVIPPRPRPISVALAPAVTIEPPHSPPKPDTAVQSMTLASNRLAADSPITPTAPTSSRHFRMPSRPQTPSLENHKSPLSLAIQPPEPPPPRRSGEMRREASVKALARAPPPVNRAEKPRLTGRQHPSPNLSAEYSMSDQDVGISPFNSPPSSVDGNSNAGPDREMPPPITRPRPTTLDDHARFQMVDVHFDPPPVHHTVVSRRRDQETPRVSPNITGDDPASRPTLPSRHGTVSSRPARPSTETQRPATVITRPSMDTQRPVFSNVRPSADLQRPAINSNTVPQHAVSARNGQIPPRPLETGTYGTPPKRIFSTPTTQQATPPRHNRSMTVDQTSDRAPAEFRTPVKALAKESALQRSASAATEPGFSASVQYPDPSKSNRRPPHHKQGPSDIQFRSDTRIFDVCGDYVCATGSMTRVWSLKTGEQVFQCAHGEGIVMKSVAFKPAADINEEGDRIWLGNNFGEITELDIVAQSTVGNKVNAHARHEVIKIYRHNLELWTLDDVGTLHVWGAASGRVPSLENTPHSHRVPKGHSFSMVVDDELWYATGKDLRIYAPSADGTAQFQILQRPISQDNAGDITTGTVLSGQPDRVYIGHNDGKVSLYAKSDYACLGVISVNMYKINTLAGEDNYLWAGYNTGMIYIYDTTQTPWVVKKDWRAHENPVLVLLRDRASFWKMDRSQIVSFGADNKLGIWDGMLQEDWLEQEMQSNDASFCRFEQIKALVVTWNAGASTPSSLRYNEQDASFMRTLLQSSDSPDIVIFGFQELVDLEDKKTTAKSFFKSKKKDPEGQNHMSHQYRDWRDHLERSLDEFLPGDEIYQVLHSSNLVGLFTCIFVKASLKERIKGVCGAEVKRGMGGLHGNKGALIVRFMLADTSICLINCHLAAGQTSTKDRNYDITEILESKILPAERDPGVCIDSFTSGGDGSMVMDHEMCILNGDLNYRIDTMSRDAVVNAVKTGNLGKLLERDQLLVSKRKNPAFRLRAFQELPIEFNPTYKYDVGQDRYDTSEKRRAPAWCDRILFRCRNVERLKQLDYRRHEVKVSDHRPVSGLFHLTIKTISRKKRTMVWDDCRRRLDEVKVEWALVSMTEYLTNVCGYDLDSSLQMIRDNYKARK